MSKLLKQYEELKRQNSSIIYLFRVGIFYNILNDDEKILNEKNSKYNPIIVKGSELIPYLRCL